MNKINLVTAPQMRSDLPKFRSGDTVNIHVKVIEGDKERIQQYQGIVMGIKGSGIGRTFRVRKISGETFTINLQLIKLILRCEEL